MNPSTRKLLITAFDFFPNRGGVATYAWEVAESLASQGFEVLVLAKKSQSPLPEKRSFEVKRVWLPNSAIMATPWLTFQISKLLVQWKPTAVFCTLWMPGAFATLMAKLLLQQKIAVFTVVHAMEILSGNKNWKQRMRSCLNFTKNWTFQNIDHVFCVSHFSKDLVLANSPCPPEKISVVNNGVNPQNFILPKNNNTPSALNEKGKTTPFRLLTVCRMVPNKGVDTVIESLPELLKTHSNVLYHVAGTGPDLERLKKLTQQLNLKNHVEFLGSIDNKELIQFYQEADLFVLLSRFEPPHVEGFGLVFLEAALCGTPSLGGRSGGIPDAIIEGSTGWLVPPNNPQATATVIAKIIDSPEQLQQFSRNAQQLTLESRTWNHVGKKLSHTITQQSGWQ